MSFPENLDDGIRLALDEVGESDGALQLDYRVENATPHRVWLVNRLFHRRPAGFEVDPNVVYAGVGPGPVLYLCKQLIEVPEHLDVEAPEVPYVTPLPAGEAVRETVRVAQPVEPHDPYEPQERATEPYVVDQLVFSLGYVLEDEPVDAAATELATGGMQWRIRYDVLLARQRLKAEGPVAATVRVIAALAADRSAATASRTRPKDDR